MNHDFVLNNNFNITEILFSHLAFSIFIKILLLTYSTSWRRY